MPLPQNRKLYRGQVPVPAGKGRTDRSQLGYESQRGALRAAVNSDDTPWINKCCRCMYNTDRCRAIKKSNLSRCNFCATPGQIFCKFHIEPESRAGTAPANGGAGPYPPQGGQAGGGQGGGGQAENLEKRRLEKAKKDYKETEKRFQQKKQKLQMAAKAKRRLEKKRKEKKAVKKKTGVTQIKRQDKESEARVEKRVREAEKRVNTEIRRRDKAIADAEATKRKFEEKKKEIAKGCKRTTERKEIQT